MDIFIRQTKNHDHSPLEQLVALSTTVLLRTDALTVKALQRKALLAADSWMAPYASQPRHLCEPASGVPKATCLRKVAYTGSELIVALGCPESLKQR